MAEKLRLKISPAVAVYAAAGVNSADRLAGIQASAELVPVDRVTLLFCLMRDKDATVRESARSAFIQLPEEVLLGCINSPATHPAILDAIAQIHYSNPDIVAALLLNPVLSRPATEFLDGIAFAASADVAGDDNLAEYDDESASGADVKGMVQELPEGENPVAEETPFEEGDEYFSKFQLIQQMGISEKIKMALTGDKEWRSILINDNNKLVSGSVIRNPRITDGEIIRILKVGVQNEEIIRLICANKEWVKNYQIRKALVDSPKTPVPNALRFLSTLSDKDIAGYAKSKNVSSVLSTHAKRIILAKKR